jgi:probable addiction module antidote protein
MMAKTTKWDATEHLKSDAAIAAYLEAAFEDGDPRVVAHALGNVAKAKGITKIATETGLTRAGLYKALAADGDPRLTTLMGTLKSVGMTISVRPRRTAKKSVKAA